MSSLVKAGLTGFFLVFSLYVTRVSAATPASADSAMSDTEQPSGLITTQTLQATLQTRHSATAVLQDHCRRLAPDETLRAVRLPTKGAVPPPDLRRYLQVADSIPINLRHVRLECGQHILSDAWNWYVPSRLKPGMEQILSRTHIPFGRAVSALHFVRHQIRSDTQILPPGVLLRNHAVLARGEDKLPFSYVEETYLTGGFNSLHTP